MSLWRAKKRYEANQDLNELADSTLLAITFLRNDIDDFDAYSESDLEVFFQSGADLLRNIKRSIDSPETVADYHVALANHLRTTGTKQTPSHFEQELEIAIEVFEQASEDLEWRSELNEIEKLFRRIEDFTSETSTRNLDNVKSNLAVGNR